MLLQTNSYVVPKEKRAEHARLIRRFKHTLNRLGCDHFEAYEQVGSNWSGGETSGRFVQIMRFRDRKQQLAVQAAERNDSAAQQLIAEFCELINFPYQQQQGLFAVGFYHSALPQGPTRGTEVDESGKESESPPLKAHERPETPPIPTVPEPTFVDETPPEEDTAAFIDLSAEDEATHDDDAPPAENSQAPTVEKDSSRQ